MQTKIKTHTRSRPVYGSIGFFYIEVKPRIVIPTNFPDYAKFALVLEVRWYISNLSHNIINAFLYTFNYKFHLTNYYLCNSIYLAHKWLNSFKRRRKHDF